MSSNNGHTPNGGPPRRRVVVTGIGAVSPNGIGREAYWRSLRCGRSGVDLISQFPTDELSCQIAGEVKNFRAEDFYRRRICGGSGEPCRCCSPRHGKP